MRPQPMTPILTLSMESLGGVERMQVSKWKVGKRG